jgi:hypothetical protein
VNEISIPDWPRVKAAAEAKLISLRKRNDSTDLDAVETAALRGEIRALKWLIALPEEAARTAQTPPPAWPGDGQL